MKFFGRRTSADTPASILLSGYESEDHFQSRIVDWESGADNVSAGLADALVWIGTSDRQVEVIEARGRIGRVVALVAASGTEWIKQ